MRGTSSVQNAVSALSLAPSTHQQVLHPGTTTIVGGILPEATRASTRCLMWAPSIHEVSSLPAPCNRYSTG